MAQAKHGDTVKVHYTGTLAGGEAFDSSAGRDPLEFTIGKGMVIVGFENAVIGMTLGETRKIIIPPEEAYGPHHPEGVQEIGRDEIPPDIDLEEGVQLQAQDGDGRSIMLTVVAVGETSVTLDANHPLAGEELTFEIELVEIG